MTARGIENLERMRRGQALRWLDEWERLLNGPVDKLLAALVCRRPRRAASCDRTRRSRACSVKRNALRFSRLGDRSDQDRWSGLRSVDVASVFDGHDQDRVIRFVDSVQDPVVSSTGTVKPFEFES